MDPKQIEEFRKGLTEIKDTLGTNAKAIEEVKTELDEARKENQELNKALDEVRRLYLRRAGLASGQVIRRPGHVSNECAKYLACVAVVGAAGRGKDVNDQVLEWSKRHLIDVIETQKGDLSAGPLAEYQRNLREAQSKTALTTSDIPLPVGYSGEIVELVEEYGTFRQYATVFPLGPNQTNLPRLKTDPAFGFVDMSAPIGEKSPQIEFVTFTPEKAGGIVRIPSEIDEDSIVALGQFIARYIARQMASWEDVVGWTADGSATYKTIEGVADRVVDNAKVTTLGATLTSPDDATLADIRSIRARVSSAVIGMASYYFHITYEVKLNSFNTLENGQVYRANGVMGASLDGFPIRWINKLPVYTTDADANKVFGLFGDMTYWYMGVRGGMRIDTSSEVYFATDEIGIRALERFTVEEMATDAMSGIRTAAA